MGTTDPLFLSSLGSAKLGRLGVGQYSVDRAIIAHRVDHPDADCPVAAEQPPLFCRVPKFQPRGLVARPATHMQRRSYRKAALCHPRHLAVTRQAISALNAGANCRDWEGLGGAGSADWIDAVLSMHMPARPAEGLSCTSLAASK